MTLPHSIALRSRVPARADGATLLDYLLQRFPYHDRATWLGEIARGRLLVGERAGRAEHVLRRGAIVTYFKEHREPIVDDDIRVMHDDGTVVVVEKPAHLPMHADGPYVRNTFINLLRTALASPALQLAHRLDRETSGLCVVPRTRAARVSLQDQFRTGTVQKAYVAVVHGRVERDFACEQPIGLAASSAIALRRTAQPGAIEPRPACTRFEVQKRGEARTMLRCVPKTGRTHQIRVHLEAAGFPLVGDKLYGRSDADYLAFVARVKAGGDARDVPADQPDRHLLHASELCFDHPETGQRLAFRSAPPAIFDAWLGRS